MKCPVCGHKVRPSKKYPGKYLCDTCRKRFPASAVIPDDTDTRSARSSAHKHGSVSGKKRPAARQQAFFDDPLNGPETYHSTAAAMRSMRKNVPEAEEAEAQKKATEKRTCNFQSGLFVLRIENIYNCNNYYVSYCTACICYDGRKRSIITVTIFPYDVKPNVYRIIGTYIRNKTGI